MADDGILLVVGMPKWQWAERHRASAPDANAQGQPMNRILPSHRPGRCLAGSLLERLFFPIGAVAVLGLVTVSQAAEGKGADTKSRSAAPAESAQPRDEGQPIVLTYVEGDLAGLSSILSEDGKTVIGMIDYRQHLSGDVLEIVRIARFADGSSDEDKVRAHVGKTLRTIGGKSIIRNTKGVATVELEIDIAKDRIKGFSGLGKERKDYDQEADLSPATYWGPLVGIVLKNFEKNAVDGQLRFHTVVSTPKPRAFHMELVREEKASISRAGSTLAAQRFSLSPSINALLDPLLKMVVPKTDFFMQATSPPALVRFAGPRNYADQKIRIE